jgi:hypothetical protein
MRTFIVFCVFALAVAGPRSLYAQNSAAGSRLQKSVGESGISLSDPGNFGSGSAFKTNSYGLTGSGGQYGAPTTNIMGSTSNNSTSPYTFNYGGLLANRSAAPIVPGVIPSAASSNDLFYKGLSSNANAMDIGGEGSVGALLRHRSSLWLSEGYSQTEHRLGNGKEDREPIKSLVPVGGGLYHDYIESGEKAFQTGDYTAAFSKFRMANYIGQKDPESLLSMSQAQFGGKCYPLAAYYLRQALRYMPRLPMLPLRPKAFYGDPSVYVQNVQDLNEYLVGHPRDTDALLLRAYYAWFDADATDPTGVARDSLQKALAGNNTPDVTLAIEAFWEGMVASGKVKGTLKPLPLPKADPGGKKS